MKVLNLQNIISLLLNSDSHGFLEPSFTNPAVLVFSGSKNINDFRKNINIVPRSWPPQNPSGTVHGGFASKLEMLLNEDKQICDFINDNDDIILAGHSLGGATSILLASMVPKKINSIYTFGAPPLSSLEFKKYSKSIGLYSKTFRYTTPKDPVSNLVPVYHHIGNKILLPYESKSRLQHHDIETYQMLLKNMGMENWILYP
jgi:pimeloyl-ACP methyl ester carboxylesterase